MKEMMKATGIVLLFCLLFTAGLFSFTPYPATSLVQNMFKENNPTKEPENYQEIKKKITIEKNLTYDSLNDNNEYDLLLPKQIKEKIPVIIWVHGGAFISGSKEDVEVYGHALAEDGYAVVTMNYALGPKAHYPSPVIQLGELYESLLEVADNYQLDMNQLIFAGDSAGAHIATQFVNVQLNESYSNQLNIKQRIPKEAIKGLLLYCGIYSVKDLDTQLGHSLLARFFINRIGWAYIGEKNWENHKNIQSTDLFRGVQEAFPPTFITDGNTMSFEEQGRSFERHLSQLGTPVTTVFYPKKQGKTMHEYQFDLTTQEGLETLYKTKEFLNGL